MICELRNIRLLMERFEMIFALMQTLSFVFFYLKINKKRIYLKLCAPKTNYNVNDFFWIWVIWIDRLSHIQRETDRQRQTETVRQSAIDAVRERERRGVFYTKTVK